jgi:hypothetical protein
VEKKNNGMISEKQTGEVLEGRGRGVIEGNVPAFTDRYRHLMKKKTQNTMKRMNVT